MSARGSSAVSAAARAALVGRLLGQAAAGAPRRPLRFSCQLASGSKNKTAPKRIIIQPARLAMVPTTDQPQAPSSRPRSVSPWNRVAFSVGERRVRRCRQGFSAHLCVGLSACDLGEVDVDEVVGVRLGLSSVDELLAGVLFDPR